MLENVSTDTTIIGLILFFTAFLGIIIYTYSPSRKSKMKEHGNIPFKEEDNG